MSYGYSLFLILVCLPWSCGLLAVEEAAQTASQTAANQGESADSLPEQADPDLTEQQRQRALGQYQFLADLARRCPLTVQSHVLNQLVDEHRLATQQPRDRRLNQILDNRETLRHELQQRLLTLHAVWSPDHLEWSAPVQPLTVAVGLNRIIILEMYNDTNAPLSISAAVPLDQPTGVNSVTIPPGSSQPLLLQISAESEEAELAFTSAQATRTLKLPVSTVAPARLRVELLDGESGSSTAARMRVEGSHGQLRMSGPFAGIQSFTEKPVLLVPSMGMAAVPFFYADGSFEIDLPPGNTSVTLERGFEHEPVTETISLLPGETRDLRLVSKRILNAKEQGWVSGDTHIHWVTNAWNVDLLLRDLAFVQRAEDLRVANNLTLLHRTATDAFIKPSQAPIGPVAELSDQEYHIEMAEEYRNQNLYGHLCFLNLQWLVLPIGTGPDIAGDDSLDYPINKTAILEARGQGGISIEAHGIGANHELPLNAVHGLTDSVDQIDPEDYYRLLDCGFQLPLTNGSDHPARIVGCARAYVQIDGPFDYEKWVDGIRRGRTFTTSGPLLFLTVNDQGPGSVLLSDARETLSARLRAVSRFPLGRVQILSNGKVLKEVETCEREVVLECEIPADESRWVVARCSRNQRWNALWHPDIAHTSAIYIHHEGRAVFRDQAAREWIQRMQMHSRDILMKGRFANANQRDEAIAYTNESIRRYERLIQSNRHLNLPSDFDAQRDRLLMQAAFVSPGGHDAEFIRQVSAAQNGSRLQKAAESLTLLRVNINPESRVKLAVVSTPDSIVQHRSHRFLVQIHNEARIQAPLHIQVRDRSSPQQEVAQWCSLNLMENILSSSLLTGEEYEWKLLELRCSEAGYREIHLEADAGQGTQDLGFRASADLLLKCVPRGEYRAVLKPGPP